jgi:hypothetical protein
MLLGAYASAQEEWTPEPEPARVRKPTRAKASKPNAQQRYVRRSYGFQRIEEQELKPREKPYRRDGNAFVRCGRVSIEREAV